MKWILLFFFCIAGFAYAADGNGFNELTKLSHDDALTFARAICEGEINCHYGVDAEPHGPFVKFFEGYFWFHKVIYGKFSQGEMPEAFVHVFESNESEYYGRGFLFRYQNDRWNYIALGEPPLGHCGRLAGLEKDLLICYEDAGTHITDLSLYEGLDGSGFVMSWLDFGVDVVQNNKLVSFSNSFSVFCDQRAKYIPAPYYEFLEISLSNIDANGYIDLVLKIGETQFDTKHCYDRETGLLQRANDTILHELTWLFDDETFTPTPETQAFLETLQTQQ